MKTEDQGLVDVTNMLKAVLKPYNDPSTIDFIQNFHPLTASPETFRDFIHAISDSNCLKLEDYHAVNNLRWGIMEELNRRQTK